MNKMNKLGNTLAGYTEAGLFIVLFIVILTAVVVNMNVLYGGNNDGSFGIVTKDTQDKYTQYQSDLQTSVKTGEAQSNALTGVSVTSSWAMAKMGFDITWSVISGGWIRTAVGIMKLPDIVGIIFQILYVISVGYIVIKLLFKVSP